MPGIGHNRGPSMEAGHRWRTYQWRRAQKALMPNTIPMMIVRMRVKRAAELGMSYKTYATIRQASGRDVMGLLFSSNALRIMGGDAAMPRDRAKLLEAMRNAERLALVQRPLDADIVSAANPCLDATELAPDITTSWSDMQARVRGFVTARGLVGGQVVVVGDTALEAEWAPALRAADFLPSEQYFPT
ncbi:hypothetical protein [uncultured Tateyamaria sp.]|uniref:hypothetical protein n=1 Tax=uncultured Tateyamaria sp. TaxID=455651 RepID=UPI002608608C|nr:hypothetical protein [uncultured Tateyamaria sp.]